MIGLAESMSDLDRAIAAWEQAAEALTINALFAIASRAVEILQSQWPVDTGASRAAWRVEARGESGCAIVCATDYSSFTFEKGDTLRTPIYLDAVPLAIEQAAREIGLDLRLQDLTEAYFGQGRRTANVEIEGGGVIGVQRKMTMHTPPDQVDAWKESMPEVVERVRVNYRGKWIEAELVPSDTIAPGGIGQREVRGGGWQW